MGDKDFDSLFDDLYSKFWVSNGDYEAYEETEDARDAITRAMDAINTKAAPLKGAQPNSAKIDKVELNRMDYAEYAFSAALKERDGECFRTEVRDSGVFICGVHQKLKWEPTEDLCPDVDSLQTLMREAMRAAVDRFPKDSKF